MSYLDWLRNLLPARDSAHDTTYPFPPVAIRHTPVSVLARQRTAAEFPYFVGKRPRLATCGGVAWFHGFHLATLNLLGNAIHTYRFDPRTHDCLPLQTLVGLSGLARPEMTENEVMPITPHADDSRNPLIAGHLCEADDIYSGTRDNGVAINHTLGRPARILIENGAHELRNFGDIAMLQTTVRRLEHLLPGASVSIVTDDPMLLARFCPNAHAVPSAERHAWARQYRVTGDLPVPPPSRLRRALQSMVRLARRWIPEQCDDIVRQFLRPNAQARGWSTFAKAFVSADLVIASGGGYLNNEFSHYAAEVLGFLDAAKRLGIPTVLLGQGLGPLSDEPIFGHARAVLPQADLICVREGEYALSTLRSLGVAPDRIMVTGDDGSRLVIARV